MVTSVNCESTASPFSFCTLMSSTTTSSSFPGPLCSSNSSWERSFRSTGDRLFGDETTQNISFGGLLRFDCCLIDKTPPTGPSRRGAMEDAGYLLWSYGRSMSLVERGGDDSKGIDDVNDDDDDIDANKSRENGASQRKSTERCKSRDFPLMLASGRLANVRVVDSMENPVWLFSDKLQSETLKCNKSLILPFVFKLHEWIGEKCKNERNACFNKSDFC